MAQHRAWFSRTRRPSVAGIVTLLASLLANVLTAAPAVAQCGWNLRNCLGAASDFQIVALNRAFLLPGRSNLFGGSLESTLVEGSVCATTALLKGHLERTTWVSEDLIVTAESGLAVRFAKVGATSCGFTSKGTSSPVAAR